VVQLIGDPTSFEKETLIMIAKLTVLAFAAAASFSVLAQNTVHYREGQRVDPKEVAKILSAAPTKTRSIRMLDQGGASQSKEGEGPSLSIPVRFGFDSAEIVGSARPQLDALAAGIKMLPPGTTVVVEGHSDAVGSDEYNKQLSKRRATAVKQYLVRVHGIEEERLKEVGLGEQRPIEGADPQAPQNRRVQFRGG
jgi:outer membrane protein OmpA-like peptidoglycan-associated protein